MRLRLRYLIHSIGFGWLWFLYAVLGTEESWVKLSWSQVKALSFHCCHKLGNVLFVYLPTKEHVPSDFAASGTKFRSVASEVISVLPMFTECSRSALRKHFYSKVKPWQKFNSRCAIAPKHRRWVGLTWHCIFDTSKIIKASCACVEMKPFLTNRGRHMCSRIIAT